MEGSLTFPTNEWTHLAMTYDGANLRSYVNGEQDMEWWISMDLQL